MINHYESYSMIKTHKISCKWTHTLLINHIASGYKSLNDSLGDPTSHNESHNHYNMNA